MSFKQLKEMVYKLDKRIPKCKQDQTQVEIWVSESEKQPFLTIIRAGGVLGNTKMSYSKKKQKVTIKADYNPNTKNITIGEYK